MSVLINPKFNPLTQNFTIILADGVSTLAISLPDLDEFFFYNAASCINYGAQMGACLIMFFVVIALTKDSNRLKFISIINLLSLSLGFVRALLLSLYFVGPWSEAYASLSNDYSEVPRSAYATSIAAAVIPLLMTITVDMSLVYQAHTVCRSLDNQCHRAAVFGLSILVFLIAVGFRFAEAVTNCEAIMVAGSSFYQSWIQTGTLATETGSIWFFSIIFTGKLAWTLYNRRRMGWKQWSAVRILAAMGGCTMIIPSVFACLEYVTPDKFPEAGTFAITMVALLLPLSSLWARMATDYENASLNLSHLSNTTASTRTQAGSIFSGRYGSQSTAPTSNTEFMSDRKGSMVPISPISIDSVIEAVPARRDSAPRESADVDLQSMGVKVNHSYSSHSWTAGRGYGPN